MNITLSQLIGLSMKNIMTSLRRMYLNHQLAAYQRHLQAIKRQRMDAFQTESVIHREMAHLQAELNAICAG